MKCILLMFIPFFMSSCGDSNNTPAVIPPTLVTTALTIKQDLPTFVTLPGTTVSVHSVEIQARIEGWILERHFQEGDMVKFDDLLYVLDSGPYSAQLLQAEAELASAEAQAELALNTLQRNSPLAESGAISEQDFDTINMQAVTAVAQVEFNKAQVASAKLNVEYCFIHSPIAGRIGKTEVDVGSLVGPGGTKKLAEVVQLGPMYVEFNPPSTRLHLIQTAIENGVHLPIQLTQTQDDSEGQPSIDVEIVETIEINGSLVFVDNTVQATTSTFLARGEFINKTGILPGQYVEVRLELQVVKSAVMVPANAIAQQPGSHYVWTIDNQDIAKITPVILGASNGKFQHVIHGLEVGQAVVISGMKNLRAGAKVSVTNKVSK